MTLATNRRVCRGAKHPAGGLLHWFGIPDLRRTMADVVTLAIGLTTTATVHFVGDCRSLKSFLLLFCRSFWRFTDVEF